MAHGFGWFAGLAFPGLLAAQSGDLMTQVWNGVQQAQKKYTSGCGKITETRTSRLLARPMVFRGKFCAEGLARFALEYAEPDPLSIRFDQDYLNVTTGGGKHTEAIEVGGNVRRTQSYFSKDNSLENLKKNFDIAAREDARSYELKLVPRSERFRRSLNYIVVKLGKDDFLLRSLEVDGASGVHSLFTIDVTSLNSKIAPGTFEVYRPK